MGMLKFLRNIGSVERTRESIRISYEKHLAGAADACGDLDPHSVGLYGALATRSRLMGRPGSEVEIWADLAPFLGMAPGQAIEALAEYVVYLERPIEARGAWLRTLINDALGTTGPHLQLAALGIANRGPWATWLDEKIVCLIQHPAAAEGGNEDLVRGPTGSAQTSRTQVPQFGRYYKVKYKKHFQWKGKIPIPDSWCDFSAPGGSVTQEWVTIIFPPPFGEYGQEERFYSTLKSEDFEHACKNSPVVLGYWRVDRDAWLRAAAEE